MGSWGTSAGGPLQWSPRPGFHHEGPDSRYHSTHGPSNREDSDRGHAECGSLGRSRSPRDTWLGDGRSAHLQKDESRSVATTEWSMEPKGQIGLNDGVMVGGSDGSTVESKGEENHAPVKWSAPKDSKRSIGRDPQRVPQEGAVAEDAAFVVGGPPYTSYL